MCTLERLGGTAGSAVNAKLLLGGTHHVEDWERHTHGR